MRNLITVSAIALLAACGGGSGPQHTAQPSPPPPPEQPEPPAPEVQQEEDQVQPDQPPDVSRPEEIPVPAAYFNDPDDWSRSLVRIEGTTFGIGPARNGERPRAEDLPPGARPEWGSIIIRSDIWRDPNAANARKVVAFLKGFQTQENKKMDPESLAFLDYTLPKTVRLGRGTGEAERAFVEAAVRNMNMALPHKYRVSIGPDLDRDLDTYADIPDGEIHFHFTDGKALWPEDDYTDVLGIGGVGILGPNYKVRNGYAYIDRSVINDDTRMKWVILHELLHAYGIGAHANPVTHPDSVLVPIHIKDKSAPDLWLTLDGEGLLAMVRQDPGSKVEELTEDDLEVQGWGDWDESGFHLFGSLSPDAQAEFGAGYRNGLAKPWAYGTRPNGGLRDSVAQPTATWRGALLGFTGAGRTVAGDAAIQIAMHNLRGTAMFDKLKYRKARRHPIRDFGEVWGDGDLDYNIAVKLQEGMEVFVSTGSNDDDPGVVTGAFTGPEHQGAVGTLEHPGTTKHPDGLSGAFGAERRP